VEGEGDWIGVEWHWAEIMGLGLPGKRADVERGDADGAFHGGHLVQDSFDGDGLAVACFVVVSIVVKV